MAAAASLISTSPAQAGGTGSGTEPGKNVVSEAVTDEKSTFDRIWDLAYLYKDEKNPFIQEVKLRGRYQGLYFWVDSDQGDTGDWEDRRSRFGVDMKFFSKKLELRFDFESNDGFEELYYGLVDAYLKWKPSKNFDFTLGRQKPMIAFYGWYQPWITQPYVERSQMFNQLSVNRVTGILAQGRKDSLQWSAGFYSNDGDKEFGGFEGGVSTSLGIGWDFAEALGAEKALVRLDWLHSEREVEDTLLNSYDDIFTATLWWTDGPWEVVLEGYAADGGKPSMIGAYLQPSYEIISDKLKAVLRYTYSSSDEPTGLKVQKRYESRTAGSKATGETYQALYAGLEYKIYGDNLKFLAGVERALMDDGPKGESYDGTTFMGAFLLHF